MERQDTNQRVRKQVSETALSALTMPAPYQKAYHGIRRRNGKVEVWVEEPVRGSRRGKASRTLPLCLEVRNHSPCGFEWGYEGSGPAQLALALMLDATGDERIALRNYQGFKRDVVAYWDNNWTISARNVREHAGIEDDGLKELKGHPPNISEDESAASGIGSASNRV
ncbi:MAG: hypothetical protein C5B50_05575 [Verrucomicrobia bacterium]|nr:MAG: hypothetical protein C5B50_05575 [Verrucomicrobiota bacterium]